MVSLISPKRDTNFSREYGGISSWLVLCSLAYSEEILRTMHKGKSAEKNSRAP